jgi:pyruvate dehydrogenase E2 component (dihydrolipoamide acetyltransferase)
MGYDMTEGSIQNWVKKEGDRVEKGDTIAEVETDKATVDMEAYASGILKKIVVPPGEVVPVGAVIAVIADENEEVDWQGLGIDPGGSAATAQTTPTASGATGKSAGEGGQSLSPDISVSLKEVATAAPVAHRVEEGNAVTYEVAKTPPGGSGNAPYSRRPVAANLVNLHAPVPATGGPGGAVIPAETTVEIKKAPPSPSNGASKAPTVASGETNGRIKSSPLARKVASDLGIDLSAIQGTGPGGRIVRADVENYAQSVPASARSAPAPAAAVSPAPGPARPAPAPTPVAVPGADYEEVALSRMRQTVARRMSEAKQQIPHFYVSNEIDMTSALKLRQTINAALSEDKNGVKVSINDIVIKAAAKVLRTYPAINNAYVDGKLRINQRVNISVAVSLPEGLITPVIFDADQKSIGQVAAEARALIEKARAGSLRPEEYQGGTFTVSNMGMYDATNFSAIINSPQAAILAVGAVKPTVVVKGGSVEDGTAEFGAIQQLAVTVSVDHRATDGVVAAQFLQELKRLLQNPMLLLV